MTPNFCNHGVMTEIGWPRKETSFEFGSHEIVVFPPAKDFDASLHIDCARSGIDSIKGMSILSQVLSIGAWLDDTFAVLNPGFAGSVKPARPRRVSNTLPSSIVDHWCNSWHPIKDAEVRRALALYREAMNMYNFHSVPYSVLGLYKILETTFDGGQRKQFIETELTASISRGDIEDHLLREIGFANPTGAEQLTEFLRTECRHAVAHAGKDRDIDPDDMTHVRRMSVAAQLLRPLARRYIQTKLGVGTNCWNQSATTEE